MTNPTESSISTYETESGGIDFDEIGQEPSPTGGRIYTI